MVDVTGFAVTIIIFTAFPKQPLKATDSVTATDPVPFVVQATFIALVF